MLKLQPLDRAVSVNGVARVIHGDGKLLLPLQMYGKLRHFETANSSSGPSQRVRPSRLGHLAAISQQLDGNRQPSGGLWGAHMQRHPASYPRLTSDIPDMYQSPGSDTSGDGCHEYWLYNWENWRSPPPQFAWLLVAPHKGMNGDRSRSRNWA